MKYLFGAFLFLGSLCGYSQSFLNRYPAIHYTSFPLKPLIESDSAHPSYIVEIGSLGHEDKYAYSITLRPDAVKEITWITIKKNGHTLQKIEEPTGLNGYRIDSAYVADINGDGLADVKFMIPMQANKTNRINRTEVYLFQHPKHGFTKISFGDVNGRRERDMDRDKNYEIITRALRSYKGHNYWIFNVYQYTNGDLLNVSKKYGYPRMALAGSGASLRKVPVALSKSFSPVYPVGYDKR